MPFWRSICFLTEAQAFQRLLWPQRPTPGWLRVSLRAVCKVEGLDAFHMLPSELGLLGLHFAPRFQVDSSSTQWGCWPPQMAVWSRNMSRVDSALACPPGLVTSRSGLGSTPCAFFLSASHSLTPLAKRYGYRFIINIAILFCFFSPKFCYHGKIHIT